MEEIIKSSNNNSLIKIKMYNIDTVNFNSKKIKLNR